MADFPTFTYDKITNRYRYTSGDKNGQFVAESVIKKLVLTQIGNSTESITGITSLLLNGQLSVSTWESAVAQELKRQHIIAYSVGKGGKNKLTQSDYGYIGNRLRFEYEHLRRFSQDILDGKLSERQILNRIRLYNHSLYVTYSQAIDNAWKQSGVRWEKWDAVDDGGTCADCSGKAALGWQPFGTLGLPGVGVQCMSNCRCSKRYSKDLTVPSDERLLVPSLSIRYGWIH